MSSAPTARSASRRRASRRCFRSPSSTGCCRSAMSSCCASDSRGAAAPMRRATSTALSAAKNCCMSSRRVERGREGGSMRALFLGNVAADTANGIRAELPPEIEIEIVADPKELTPKAAAATDILVTNIWRTDYPAAPRIALVQSVATGIEWIEQAALPRGIPICNAYGHETAIAEYVLMVMLAWSHRFRELESDFRLRS